MYEMCALQRAFPDSDLQTLVSSIVAGAYRPVPDRYSSVLAELIKVMLR